MAKRKAAAAPVSRPLPTGVPDLLGPYNWCPTCGFTATQIKFCPLCGPELKHVGAERVCPHCTNLVWFKKAKFCGMCGLPLEVEGDHVETAG
jgi:NADH pyrophosphatase NudC (nudix superfamily)